MKLLNNHPHHTSKDDKKKKKKTKSFILLYHNLQKLVLHYHYPSNKLNFQKATNDSKGFITGVCHWNMVKKTERGRKKTERERWEKKRKEKKKGLKVTYFRA
ncbi:hypothetical protein AAZX31_12G084500 [Glycine max]